MSGRELFLVGLSHKSAPIEVRERVALSGDDLKGAFGTSWQKDVPGPRSAACQLPLRGAEDHGQSFAQTQ